METKLVAKISDSDYISAALEAGIMLSSFHGQQQPGKPMPVLDLETLKKFVDKLFNRDEE